MKKLTYTIATLILTTSLYSIERDYVPRAILTKEQEKVVLELAGKSGITTISKFDTSNFSSSK